MIMWIAALVLVAVTVAVGYRQGAIRGTVSFIGLIVALFLAMPLAKWFEFPFRFIHVHPALPQFLSPLIAFLVVSLLFKALGAFVHRKADYHYRYHVDDAHRAFWERMNRRVGACVGVLNGLIYFLVLAVVVDVFGYFALQMGGTESESKVLSWVAKGAEDLQATGMNKVTAAFNPAQEKYFETSDILGLIYHNRPLVGRLKNYPVFAAMAERPMFQAIAADNEAQGLLSRPSTLSELLANPNISEVATNKELYEEVMQVDLQDLRQYLEKGVSPKFANERILGRWAYVLNDAIKLNKARNQEIGATDWFKLKSELSERFAGTVFTAFYDNKASLKLAASAEGRASPVAPVLVAPGRTNQVPRWFDARASYSANGKWSGSAPNYLVTLGNRNGTSTSEGKLVENKLSFQFEGKALAFEKLPD